MKKHKSRRLFLYQCMIDYRQDLFEIQLDNSICLDRLALVDMHVHMKRIHTIEYLFHKQISIKIHAPQKFQTKTEMYYDDYLTSPQTQISSLGWTYLNFFSLIFLIFWSLMSILAIYYLWYTFHIFQMEIQDITFEIVDFHSNDIETKPREIVRLVHLHDGTTSPSRAITNV